MVGELLGDVSRCRVSLIEIEASKLPERDPAACSRLTGAPSDGAEDGLRSVLLGITKRGCGADSIEPVPVAERAEGVEEDEVLRPGDDVLRRMGPGHHGRLPRAVPK